MSKDRRQPRELPWRIAMFEIGRPPVVVETPFPLRLVAWLATLPRRLTSATNPGVTWRAIRVPGWSTVHDHDFADWHPGQSRPET